MDIDKKQTSTISLIDKAIKDFGEDDQHFFSGSINVIDTNSSFLFNFVNGETLSYILNEAKTYDEVTIEIFRHDEASEALQRQDNSRHTI